MPIHSRRRVSALVAPGAALMALAACGPGRAPAPRPDVVVITLDTFRGDRLGARGNPGGLTPNLDLLAAEGILFERATTPIGTTHPSHASMFTGLYPGEHGVRFNGDRLAASQLALAERLAAEGYETAAFVAKRSLLKRGGLDQGFRVTSDAAGAFDGEEQKIRSGDEVNALVAEFLAGGVARPLFLWVHYFETHTPLRWTPHAAAACGDYDGPLEQGASTELFYAYGGAELPATPENRRMLEALYDGEVKEADQLVGELRALLAGAGLLDDALVIVAGDHGEMLGEHGEVGHGTRLWQPVLDVPLIIWRSGAPLGRRVQARVSLVDLLPTVLEAAGAEAPGTPGRSLFAALAGRPFDEVHQFAAVRVPTVKEATVEEGEDTKAVCVFQGPFKLVVDEAGERLYRLDEDPGEERPLDLSGADRAAAAVLEKLRPLAYMHRLRERPGTDLVELPPDVLEEMRQLGYIR